MDLTLIRNWWAVLIRGLAGVAFGVLTFVVPHISLALLVLLFAAYVLADGIFAIASGIRHRGQGTHWGTLVLEGVFGVAAGILTLVWPGITAVVLLYLIAAWAVVTGALEISAAIRLRKIIRHEWLLGLGGLASIALGVFLFAHPGVGALVVVLWIGAYALVEGFALIALSFRLRNHGRPRAPEAVPHPA